MKQKVIELHRHISLPVLKIEGSFYIIVLDDKNKYILESCDEEGILQEQGNADT